MGDLLDNFLADANVMAPPAPENPAQLTVRSVGELLAMNFDDSDNLFGDRLLSSGSAAVLLGLAGVGKSRWSLQLSACSIVGLPFLGIQTHARGKRWLFFQSENNNRRLHSDLKSQQKFVGVEAWREVEKCLFIHTLENDIDPMLALASNPAIYLRCANLMKQYDPDIVVFDPLRDLSYGDLNKDADMAACCQAMSALFREGNPNRACLVLHHSLTGAAGAARATGYDRSSFGRNSKVLFGWARAVLNLAPATPDDNSKLVLACGKNNNGREFAPIGITCDPQTLIFHEDPNFDRDAWQQSVSGKNAKPRFEPSKDKLLAQIPGKPIQKKDLLDRMAVAGWPQKHARVWLNRALEDGTVCEINQKRPNVRAAIYVSRKATDIIEDVA